MDAGIAAIGGALVGAVAALGTAALATWAQRANAQATVRSEHQKELRHPRREAYGRLIPVGMQLAERAAGDFIWIEDAARSDALELKGPIDESWLEISLLGPPLVASSATEVHRHAHVVFDHLWQLESYMQSTGRDDEDLVERLSTDLGESSEKLRDAVLAFSRTAQIALEATGLEQR
ncbi:hypothetical protein [Streptomyces sp. NPDC017868]|uniref:hypothetical protein n=1 Tax=Streptomyces sp. NPDC017868 TaxID=3365014 RepID=UPI00379C88BA